MNNYFGLQTTEKANMNSYNRKIQINKIMYTLPNLNDIQDSHSLQYDFFVFLSFVIEFCSNSVVG